MPLNNISDVTAALGAITPQGASGNGSNQQNSLSTEIQSTTTPGTHASQAATVGSGSSSFGRYNKQMLISNYLNRGRASKDVPAGDRNTPKENGSNIPVPGAQGSDGRDRRLEDASLDKDSDQGKAKESQSKAKETGVINSTVETNLHDIESSEIAEPY
ncbi:hypothetical protein DFH28DRAFT_936669 [Melampsora americana]|nr:hypothetical protein DFH28DRAFT_936669 [Melampsora americana]